MIKIFFNSDNFIERVYWWKSLKLLLKNDTYEIL